MTFDFTDILVLVVPVAIGWLWFDSLRARESAVRAARLACDADGVQLLDATVALASLRLQRGDDGWVALRRIYVSNSATPEIIACRAASPLLGASVQALYLAPHSGSVPRQLHVIQGGRD